jgi:glutamine phosphoribosylpyrophosphate amidotransferase
VHVRISSPPVAWPCFYGIDFATRAELIAGQLSVEEIRVSIGADSLGYVSLDGLITATTLPAGRLCRACFDGDYPLRVALAEQGKHLLERVAVTPAAAGPVVADPVVADPVVADPVVADSVTAGSAGSRP